MQKVKIALTLGLALAMSACVGGCAGGLSEADLASSRQIEASIMTPPPPTAQNCQQARALQQLAAGDPTALSPRNQQFVNDLIGRCPTGA